METPSHLGHMDRVAATMPSQAHAGTAQEAPDIGQWEGQDVPLVRRSSCFSKGGIPSSRRNLPTYLKQATQVEFRGSIVLGDSLFLEGGTQESRLPFGRVLCVPNEVHHMRPHLTAEFELAAQYLRFAVHGNLEPSSTIKHGQSLCQAQYLIASRSKLIERLG